MTAENCCTICRNAFHLHESGKEYATFERFRISFEIGNDWDENWDNCDWEEDMCGECWKKVQAFIRNLKDKNEMEAEKT